MSITASAHDDLLVARSTTVEAFKYPRHFRLAIVLGSSAALWALIIAGGWGLWSLIA
jgi:hypothetical protein